ncbi:class I SAM-dependent methyltransferase [Umezawaea tangerina]|uniref:class I SAM-dependent methyltransferase n=1 Tax=Umezawaea tangerina TaxID=84725 RepID=UPI000D051338|nr:class I SAM-dependent methyltransferase [Umezawaea tangerina]
MTETGWKNLFPHQVPSTLHWESKDFIQKGKGNILDLGCGSEPAQVINNDYCYVKVDINPNVVDNLRESSLKGVHIAQADATSLPFQNSTFDLILCKAIFTALVTDDACKATILEIQRVLRPGGLALVLDFLINQDDPYFTSRYKQTHDYPYGTFWVHDDLGNILYSARHFSHTWLQEMLSLTPRLRLSQTEVRPVHTRTGKPTLGIFHIVEKISEA